jgi:hypothetical protein
MSVVADLFALVRLNLDTGAFEASAAKAADSAGTTMAARLSGKINKAIGGAIGAGVGAGLASAVTGATQLNELAGEYRVQTGASTEDAKVFSAALNDLYKNAHQTYAEIADTKIGLKTHFDITGAAATALAANFLDYAEIVGGTAAEAVDRFNSLVKTGVISLADMPVMMDKVTASAQVLGVNANAVVDSLIKFAPTMAAAGWSTDQTLGIVNLFAKAGVTADRAAQGFQTALSKVHSPEEFNTVIADISNTADAFERTQKAQDLFGKRVGGLVASLLKPGQALASFVPTVEQYTDAVAKAGEINDNTFAGKALLMLHDFQGGLAGIGTNMGDLLMVAALLGPQLTRVLFAGIGGAAGILGSQVAPQLAAALTANVAPWMTAGTKAGSIFGAGLTLALPLVAAAAVVAAWAMINDGLNKQADAIATQTTEYVKTATLAEMETARAAIVAGIEKIANLPFGTLLYGDQLKSLQSDLDVVNAQILARQKDAGDAAGRGWAESLAAGGRGSPAPSEAGAAMAEDLTFAIKEKANAARDAGVDAGIEFGKGAESAAAAIVASGNVLMNAFHKPLDLAKVKTMLAGALHAKALVDGLNAGDPAVREASANTAMSILAYLDALKGPGFVAGRNAALALADGLRSTIASLPTTGLFGAALAPMVTALQGVITKTEELYPSYQAQVAAISKTVGSNTANAQLEASIAMLGGSGVTAADRFATATGGAGTAADSAKAKLRTLADDAKTNLSAAFEKVNTAARTFFDDLHSKNLRAIDDTRSLANAQLDSQIGAINAGVDAARKALADVQDARRLAELQAAVGTAADPAALASAQQALSDYLAEQNIARLEADARTKIDALTLQKDANDLLAKDASTAEDARFAAQTTAYDKEMAALQTYLDKHPAAWKATNAKVVALLAASGVTYAAAGAALGQSFADGLRSYTSALVKAETTFSITTIKAAARAGGGAVDAGVPYIVGERRAELFVPETAGTIRPTLEGLGGGGLTINGGITISAGSLAGTEAEARAFARSIYDHLDDEARRRGLTLARAG